MPWRVLSQTKEEMNMSHPHCNLSIGSRFQNVSTTRFSPLRTTYSIRVNQSTCPNCYHSSPLARHGLPKSSPSILHQSHPAESSSTDHTAIPYPDFGTSYQLSFELQRTPVPPVLTHYLVKPYFPSSRPPCSDYPILPQPHCTHETHTLLLTPGLLTSLSHTMGYLLTDLN